MHVSECVCARACVRVCDRQKTQSIFVIRLYVLQMWCVCVCVCVGVCVCVCTDTLYASREGSEGERAHTRRHGSKGVTQPTHDHMTERTHDDMTRMTSARATTCQRAHTTHVTKTGQGGKRRKKEIEARTE
jgi:hypothetical protein